MHHINDVNVANIYGNVWKLTVHNYKYSNRVVRSGFRFEFQIHSTVNTERKRITLKTNKRLYI